MDKHPTTHWERKALLRGRGNLNALWAHLMEDERRKHPTELERTIVFYAAAKFDYFRSDEGEALLLGLWVDSPGSSLFQMLRAAWVQHHIKDGITF